MGGLVIWLHAKLGNRYPVLLRGIESVINAFLFAFLGQLAAADVFNVQHFLVASIWQKAAVAGAAAVLNAVKSVVLTLITGQTSILGLVSRNLRADRSRPVVQRPLPIRPPSTAPDTPPATPTAPDDPNYVGEHEAPETKG